MFSVVTNPQNIQLYLPQGDPAGMASARIASSNVVVLRVPRKLLHDHELGDKAARNGVYVLVGGNPDGKASCLIGNSSNVGSRIVDHDVDHEHWHTAYFAVSTDDSWTRTITGHISALCVEAAQLSGRSTVDSSTLAQAQPAGETAAEVGYQAEAIALLMTVLGCVALNAPAVEELPDKPKTKRRTPARHGISLTDLIDAGLLCEGDELTAVRAGWPAVAAAIGPNGTVLWAEVEYPTPSAAGAAVRGGQATNGWDFWAKRSGSGLRRLSAIRKQYQDALPKLNDATGPLAPDTLV